MNKDLFNILLEKLNVGSMRSIYLNAVPGRYRARMDILELDKIEENFSKKLFENLFSKDKFEIKIKMTNDEKNETVEKKLQYLYNEEMNIYREEGISSFSLGYPILVKQSVKTKSIMKAPLFIWKLNITRSKVNINEFTISKEEDIDVEINKVLLMQILTDDKINLSNIFDEIVTNSEGIITFENIREIVNKINEQIPVASVSDETLKEFKLEKFPSSIEEMNERGKTETYIFQGGILGLFKRQNEGIIQDFNTIKENYDKFRFGVEDRDNFQLIKNSSISTDPSQQNVVETLTDTQYKIIQGPPGTGKSQTLSAIITNSLENGANILIVCEKKTALDVIYEKLKELELDDLTAMLSNPSKDRRSIVKRVRDLEENIGKLASASNLKDFDEQKYMYSVTEYNKLKEKYKKYQNLFEKNLKDGKTIKEDEIYSSNTSLKTENVVKNLLDSKNYDKYYFIDTEKADIQYVYKILDNINRIVNKIGSIEKIKSFEKIYSNKLLNIQSYEIFFNEANTTLEEIKKVASFITEGLNEYGTQFKDFFGVNKLKVTLFSAFNTKLKNIKNKWMDIDFASVKIEDFNKKYGNKNFNASELAVYLNELKEFSDILNDIDANRQEFVSFVNDKKNTELSKEDEAFINNFLRYIEENKIENKEEFLKSSYYYSLLQNSDLKLEKYDDFDVNIEKIIEYDKDIRSNQRFRIKKYWAEIRKRAFGNLKTEEDIKMLYNLRKNAKYGKINTLREIIAKNSAFFKNIFPVIMTDPNTCSALFPLEEGLFDLVIFDEASQLKLEEVLPTLMRGKYKIVSGDIHQMPPSNYFGAEIDNSEMTDTDNIDEEALFLADSESLLDYVNNLKSDMNMSYLDFHYRSKHPKLINFSNAAFYESRLVPMPAKNEYIPLQYFEVNGIYGGRKNDEEANKIVEYIFGDDILIDGKLPSVGIVTLNLEQKTNIVNKINEYLRKNDSDENKNRYNELIEKNMFVKNLENVQGDERDIMILSTTFGKTVEGKFIQNFGPLNNSDRGYKLLNVLVTRAKYRFTVFTSIPQENINTWDDEISKNGNNGKGIFYAYLAYAKAVATENIDMENIILEKLADVSGVSKTAKNINIPFVAVNPDDNVKKIMNIIKDKVAIAENEEIVKEYRIGGFLLDYAVKPKESNRARVVIELNKTENISGDTSSRAIIYRKGMFESLGYEYKLIDMGKVLS